MQAPGQAMQTSVCGKQQHQQPQKQLVLPEDLDQPVLPQLPMVGSRVLLSLQQTQQPQPQAAHLFLQEHKQELQTTTQQVEDICRRISAPRLISALSEFDAEMMLQRLGAMETCARIARKAVRSVNAQHPSSPPAKRPCHQVHFHPPVSAVACSMRTRWPVHEQPRNEAEVNAANQIQMPRVLTVLIIIRGVPFPIRAVFTNLWRGGMPY